MLVDGVKPGCGHSEVGSSALSSSFRTGSLALVTLTDRILWRFAHQSFQCLVERSSCCGNQRRVHVVRRLESWRKTIAHA